MSDEKHFHDVTLLLFVNPSDCLHFVAVRAMWDVEYHYNQKLDLHYFTAKKFASCSEPEIFIPISVISDVSPATVEEIQNELCPDKEMKRYICSEGSACGYLRNL